MRIRSLSILVAAYLAASSVFSQTAKPTSAAKSTAARAKKATKAIPPVIFEAHNEGSVEGPIYGDENVVSVTIDSTGLHYHSKGQEKPTDVSWDQLSGWQPNNFNSRSPSRASTTGGDYGIGLYLGTRYLSFRTRSGYDYLAAIKALRTLAPAKERAGIG